MKWLYSLFWLRQSRNAVSPQSWAAELPLSPVPTTVPLVRGVGAVVDAVAVFAGGDAGAIGALEAVALLL